MIVSPVAAIQHDQVVRLRGSLGFGDDDAVLVDDADGRLLKRDIQAGEIFHETLLMMARPEPIAVPFCQSGGRGDDRNHPIFMLGFCHGPRLVNPSEP